MAVGVVAGDATSEPDDLPDAEIVREQPLQLLASGTGIACLHFAEQTFLGGEQSATTVDVDAAAFEHHSPRLAIDL